ncbi:MAG: metal-dependent hydrolase [archaeon]|jgi:membrane-bound metal-dependent hydrolase YbcI (DUF457 family)|nr:metal-dependent hydrolase [archaeon]
MTDSENHVFASALLLLAIYFIFQPQTGDFVGFAFMMFVGALMPDWIEPAKSYTHRSFFHSKKTLLALAIALALTLLIGMMWNWMFYVSFFITGYISHLLLDWTTKMGLPN